jgi:hypothetical protein
MDPVNLSLPSNCTVALSGPCGASSVQERPFHRGMEAVYILDKTGGTKIMHISTKAERNFSESLDPTFLFIVTAGVSRYFIMHVGCLHYTIFLFIFSQ